MKYIISAVAGAVVAVILMLLFLAYANLNGRISNIEQFLIKAQQRQSQQMPTQAQPQGAGK